MKKRILSEYFVVFSVLLIGTLINHSMTASNVEASVVATSKSKKDYQLSQTFPIDEKDDNPDFDTWSLLNNVTRKFYDFAGQGEVSVYSNKPKKFGLYVNGQKVNLNSVKSNNWTKVKIGSLTKNGNNSLQISVNKIINEKDIFKIRVPYPTLSDASKQKANLQNNSFKLLDTLIKQEINHGFSSAQLVIVHNGKIIKKNAYGLLNSYSENDKRLKTGTKVNNSTLYDLASNTKMYATNFAIQKLVSEGKLDIDAKVATIFPDFQDKANDVIKGKSNLTIRDILMHQAGFPADPQYHNNNYNPNDSDKISKNSNPVYTQERSEILKKIIATPLAYKPGTKTIYSDVDYMLLGLIVEKITGQSEDDYVENNIYQQLNLTHTLFNPLKKGFSKNQIAATELNGNTRDHTINFNNIRTHTIQGEVHDEKAYYTMKGVSGHAGLFSNASDLAVLAQTVINHGGYGESKIFDEDTLDEFIKPKSTDSSYGLGWRREASGKYSWAFSNLSDANTVGHTGWTGTLTVVDPSDNTAVILLTNCRNTPIINAKKTPNDFAGSHYLLAKYGDIVGLAYAGINNDSTSANNSKLISLATQRYNEIQKNSDDQSYADKNDLHAIFNTLKARSKNGNSIEQFLKSKLGKQIKGYVLDK